MINYCFMKIMIRGNSGENRVLERKRKKKTSIIIPPLLASARLIHVSACTYNHSLQTFQCKPDYEKLSCLNKGLDGHPRDSHILCVPYVYILFNYTGLYPLHLLIHTST